MKTLKLKEKIMSPSIPGCQWLLKEIEGSLRTDDWVMHASRGHKLNNMLGHFADCSYNKYVCSEIDKVPAKVRDLADLKRKYKVEERPGVCFCRRNNGYRCFGTFWSASTPAQRIGFNEALN